MGSWHAYVSTPLVHTITHMNTHDNQLNKLCRISDVILAIIGVALVTKNLLCISTEENKGDTVLAIYFIVGAITLVTTRRWKLSL